MRRIIVLAVISFLGLIMSTLPASAARPSKSTRPIDWNQHDCAVYVVSTVNVLHSRHGRPTSATLTKRFGVARYEVWNDMSNSSLYFIQLKRADNSTVGGLAYQMGWARPMSLSPLLERLGIRRAPQSVSDAFRTDPKQIIGTFTSTLPQ